MIVTHTWKWISLWTIQLGKGYLTCKNQRFEWNPWCYCLLVSAVTNFKTLCFSQNIIIWEWGSKSRHLFTDNLLLWTFLSKRVSIWFFISKYKNLSHIIFYFSIISNLYRFIHLFWFQSLSSIEISKMLSGRLALVTGGARGIGRAVCQVLANDGARVIVADLDRNGCEETMQVPSPKHTLII